VTTGTTIDGRALTITKTADTRSAAPDGTVRYTITVTDTGQTAYAGATLTDSLTVVLGDAAYDDDAAATAGAVSFISPDLTWTGDLTTGATVTITYSVTVNHSITGTLILANTVSSDTSGSNCPPPREVLIRSAASPWPSPAYCRSPHQAVPISAWRRPAEPPAPGSALSR
jgi:uncharacterized repeat protein (TIGR01451 family)